MHNTQKTMSVTLPWQQSAWQYLLRRKQTQALPHALLIKGKGGLGKRTFAKNFATFLLCQNNEQGEIACGKCAACILLQANNHPNLLLVQPEEEGRAIKIEQIRELLITLSTTSHLTAHYVVIIEAADLLNIAAANALLKTLEEPLANILIMLVTDHPLLLPATLRSRCQSVQINVPSHQVAKEWLQQNVVSQTTDFDLALALADGSPLKALDIITNNNLLNYNDFFNGIDDLRQKKISLAEMVDKCLIWQVDDLLIKFMYLVNDLFKIKLGTTYNLVNRHQLVKLRDVAAKIKTRGLLVYQARLFELRRIILSKVTLNQQLLVENLLIGWMKL